MSIYGKYSDSFIESQNEILDQDLTGINETNIIKSVTNIADLFKQWRKAASNFAEKKWVYRFIKDDKQEAMLHKHYDKLTAEDISYGDYKKEFRFFCNFFGLNPNNIVIENIVFQPETKTQPKRIAIRYGQGKFKVKIPDDIFLIHTSPADNITALNPSFRSKVKGQYLYSSKRVFFTVLKPINQFRNGTKGQKVHKYVTKEHIDYAYIDPTYIHFNDNSVFIETDNPVPVEPADKKFKNIKVEKEETPKDNKEEKEEIKNESANLEILEETSLQDFLEMIKNWKTSNKEHAKQTFKNDSLSDEEYQRLSEDIKKMKESEAFGEYKKAFVDFCKFCHIDPHGTIITKYNIKEKEDGKHSIDVEYSYNMKKIRLPDDLALFHMSKIGGIKELIPQFKGKSEKGYLYDKPRVYFTINKFMPKFLADYKPTEKMHKYRCKKDIKDVYVDPLVWNAAQGAVYIETNSKVPVEEINGSNKEESTQEEKVQEMVLMGIEIVEEIL